MIKRLIVVHFSDHYVLVLFVAFRALRSPFPRFDVSLAISFYLAFFSLKDSMTSQKNIPFLHLKAKQLLNNKLQAYLHYLLPLLELQLVDLIRS